MLWWITLWDFVPSTPFSKRLFRCLTDNTKPAPCRSFYWNNKTCIVLSTRKKFHIFHVNSSSKKELQKNSRKRSWRELKDVNCALSAFSFIVLLEDFKTIFEITLSLKLLNPWRFLTILLIFERSFDPSNCWWQGKGRKKAGISLYERFPDLWLFIWSLEPKS